MPTRSIKRTGLAGRRVWRCAASAPRSVSTLAHHLRARRAVVPTVVVAGLRRRRSACTRTSRHLIAGRSGAALGAAFKALRVGVSAFFVATAVLSAVVVVRWHGARLPPVALIGPAVAEPVLVAFTQHHFTSARSA